ncbi:TPA: hypothetical protein U2D29_001771 [Streptococcus suis]|nr:hypothetical protein [Streptococcus suis]HEM4284756.1 hypothetical protein [Streptococcus suis]HEM6413203.1 hypothetical protein [Streptococcus suis]
MERIKEIKISFSEGDRCPRVEIDGGRLKGIVRLKLDWETRTDEVFKDNFLVEYLDVSSEKPVKILINQFY